MKFSDNMKECKIIIMGFGSVGQGIAQSIALKKAMIKDKYGVELKVVAAVDSSSSAINQDGLEEMLLIHSKNSEGKLSSSLLILKLLNRLYH